jgi:hypothetical protein
MLILVKMGVTMVCGSGRREEWPGVERASLGGGGGGIGLVCSFLLCGICIYD